MDINIAVIKGDGIGPEIIGSAISVLNITAAEFGHNIYYNELLAGGCAIEKFGVPLPAQTVEECKKSGAVLLGAVGGPEWDSLPPRLRPEKALLGLRSALGLYANIRPARLYPSLSGHCPLKNSAPFDMIIVRELIGGIYFGSGGEKTGENGREAFDTETYSEKEILRIGEVAFGYAKKRGKKVTSIDKANVLNSSRLWREVMRGVAMRNPDIEYEDMLVDNAAMQLIKNPSQFDVIVTTNMFGDILSDEASQLTGSIGLLPSASLGDGKLGLYEPIHGSAPDIAGKGIANPIASILSAAMLLSYSFGLEKEAAEIEKAIDSVLEEGCFTPDLGGFLTTGEITKKIMEKIKKRY